MLFDTHCHLDDPRLHDDLDIVLERARDAGVTRITTIGCADSPRTVHRAIAVARQHPTWVHATVGVHPHDAKHFDQTLADAVEAAVAEPEVVAVGETGLDYHYNHSTHDVQQQVFRDQIAIARQAKKPLVIHTRSAPGDTLRILREEGANHVGGIIHCFSEDATFAKAALDLGFVSSFSGIVTFKSATAVHEAARTQPEDALLIETDAPYLAPAPMRGRTNEPGFVKHTAARIAELRGTSAEALAETSYRNGMRVFGLENGRPNTGTTSS